MTGSLADYYHWEETDKGIRIYMHAGMADRLQAEVLQSGGKEVGGILLGRVEEDRGKPITIIDGFVPVPCSYRGGPQYDLAGEDTVNLEAALLRAALAGCESPDAPAIIGYYRSHLRDGLSLSPADLLAIHSYFQAPASVFLIVKAVAGNQACTAGFFFWEDGNIVAEFSSLEVALGRTTPTPPELPDLPADLLDAANDGLPGDLTELFRKAALPESPSAAAEPERPAPAPALVAVPSAQLGKTRRGLPSFLLGAATILIATAALVISVLTYLGAPRPPRQEAAAVPAASAPADASLGLRVERNPPDLLVSWNRNAREVLAAQRATLSIRDGRIEKNLDLDKKKLASGSVLVTPTGDDIQLRLEVYGADHGSVAQSIRVSPGK